MKVATPPLSRNRALALSASLVMFTFFGITSVVAHASDVTVEATVEECEVSISTSDPLVMLDPPLVTGDGFYVFTEVGGITVDWSAGDSDCAGSLHAERSSVSKDSEAVAAATVSLNMGTGFVEVHSGETVQVAESGGALVGDSTNFDVEMEIPTTAGSGTYSSVLTFTVVVGP